MNPITTAYDHGPDTGAGWGYGIGSGRVVDPRETLRPLLGQIRHYDDLRQRLETEGGDINDMTQITWILTEPIVLQDTLHGNRDCMVELVDQTGIRNVFFNLACHDVHIDVRRLPTGMPVYYLCRIRRDYWSQYSLIVEDLYLSPGYPMPDERFVRLMEFGHEIYYLRLSQFRERVKSFIGTFRLRSASYGGQDGTAASPSPKKQPSALPEAFRDEQVDDLLYRAGRHIFQAAWHEDQRPGVLTAAHFGLPHFKETIELLYLCLSGELCELRNATTPDLIEFFESAYPQPGIHAFLKLLGHLDGAAINHVPRKALTLYTRLAGSFRLFLDCKAPWGRYRLPMAVRKIVLGNFGRLPMVADILKNDDAIRQAVQTLENESQSVTAEILNIA